MSARRLQWRRGAGVAICLFAATCAPPATPEPSVAPPPSKPATPETGGLRFDVGAIDPKADACTDFYDYACGGWRKSHPIPPDQTRWTRYAEMTALNLERERKIVEEAGSARNPSAAERRVGDYYAACMGRGTEGLDLGSATELFTRIAAIRTTREATDMIGELHAHDLDAMFSRYVETDPRDSKQLVVWLDKGTLGLLDPSDYAKTDEASVTLRARYIDHLTRIFVLLGTSVTEGKSAATRVMTLESALASKALSAVDRRNHDLQVHPMTIAELSTRFPAIDFRAYFAKIGAPLVDRVNVAQPAWLDAVNVALSSSDLAAVRHYLRALLVRVMASSLPYALDIEMFDFRQRILRGTKEPPPRWKQCLKAVDGDLGDDVGRLFLARHFDDASRARVKKMADALMAAFRADLASLDWLGPAAREAAIAKLSASLFVIGASNRPRSFDGLRVEKDDPFGNAWRAQALYVANDMSSLGKPTDREAFFRPLPQELDGFGSKSKNATGFTAGFLQPPVFDPTMDDAVNYGALGSVIGHELSHQFDDEGRKFDAEGTLRPWWSPEDVARFEERATCFVDEYAQFHIEDGTPVDGKLTLGENIADNGGIRLSYSALRPSDTGPKIDGFTPAQRFFLGWAQIRCENVTPQMARRQVQSDPHSPGRFRVNGVVSNMPEFARAFGCAAGTPMAPVRRCALW